MKGTLAPEPVQSLARGLAVISAFSAEHASLTVADAARRAGLSRAAARRVLHTLTALGYARADDGKHFQLTPRALELGYAYLSSLRLPDIAQPHMEALSAKVHESVSMSVLDGPDIVYVARVSTSRIMSIAISVGTRLPAPITSMGRVLLAGLPPAELREWLTTNQAEARTDRTVTDLGELQRRIGDARTHGWALVDQELEDGVRSVAAPVKDRRGRTVAAINVSAHAGRVTLEELRRTIVPELVATAAAISAHLPP